MEQIILYASLFLALSAVYVIKSKKLVHRTVRIQTKKPYRK